MAKQKETSLSGRNIWRNRSTYLMILPALIFIFIFAYIPMYGTTLAFREYKLNLGILHSPWIGFEKYKLLLGNQEFYRALLNTIIISFGRIIFEFPVPIVVAILLNELVFSRYRKFLQTVFTFPNFLSWVIVAGVMKNFLRLDGTINQLIQGLGLEPIPFLLSTPLFKPMLFLTDAWKGMGWSAIIYLASISAINPELYTAAEVDGANRFHKIIHVTLPGIVNTIMLLLVLSIANTLNAGFDQVFNMINPIVKATGQIIDTYIYDITFQKVPDFSFSTAVGLFKSVVSFSLLISADRILRYFGGKGIYN